MDNNKVFLKRGSIYNVTEGNFKVSPTLDDGIFQTHQNPMTGEIFLERLGNKFDFDFKLYGLDNALVSHVLNTYNKQPVKRNIGILLNGAKGTGKTVTAKYLCNQLGLPVIICDKPYGGLALFLASIDHDCIFLFDEFEKNFRLTCGDGEDCAGEDLLSIMDGVYNGNCCHVFILTTNELRVNDNLLSRPSRIRYLKSFGDVLDKKIVEEFIDDNLKYPEFKNEIMDYLECLTMLSIDIVKSIVEEVNLHKCHIDEFKDFFNIKEAQYTYCTRAWGYHGNAQGVGDVSKEDFLKECNRAYGYTEEREFNPGYDSLTLKKSINKIKKGDLVPNTRWSVFDVDIEKHYLLLRDIRYTENFRHILIENMNARPNVYDAYMRE